MYVRAPLLCILVSALNLAACERDNYCPRRCIRGVQQFPFGEVCICPEYCPMFCCMGYYYFSPVPGTCPTACGMKSRPIETECCLPSGFSNYRCIIAQKRWFDAYTNGIWWWPSVFNDSSATSSNSLVDPPGSQTLSLAKSIQRSNVIGGESNTGTLISSNSIALRAAAVDSKKNR